MCPIETGFTVYFLIGVDDPSLYASGGVSFCQTKKIENSVRLCRIGRIGTSHSPFLQSV